MEIYVKDTHLTLMFLLSTLVSILFIPYICGAIAPFHSSFGITVQAFVKLTNQLYEVIVSTNAVRGELHVRVLFPMDYETSEGQRRYPVLYLLHGAGGNASAWTDGLGNAQEILSDIPIITIMPDGGHYGWYTNWMNPGRFAPQNWRYFHMEQLVPWIDDNVRSIADKFGRALAGLSMGGYGVIRYAEAYPANFAYTASFSGALDLLDARLQYAITEYMREDSKPLDGPFGPPFITQENIGWVIGDAINHASQLRNVTVALYTGNAGVAEKLMNTFNYRMRDALLTAKLPFYFDDYGNGKSIGGGCNGHHGWPCWNAALRNVMPRIMSVLKQKY